MDLDIFQVKLKVQWSQQFVLKVLLWEASLHQKWMNFQTNIFTDVLPWIGKTSVKGCGVDLLRQGGKWVAVAMQGTQVAS